MTDLDAVIERKRRTGELFTREEIEADRIVAPAVSVIVSELVKRPYWKRDQPLAVPPDLWAAAREEVKAIQHKRGFMLAVSKAVKAENFLILGTPIVSA